MATAGFQFGSGATVEQGALADSALQPNQTSSISGAYTFTGPLILPNNSRINGIEHFYQTTKPTVRGDGSALSVGDRWWKTDEGTEWFWNGTYWLSVEEFSIGSRWEQPGRPTAQINTGSFETESFLDLPGTVSQHNSHLFLTDWVYECRAIYPAVHNTNDYFTIELSIGTAGGSIRTGVVVDTKLIGGGGRGFRTYLGLYFASQIISPTFGFSNYSMQRMWLQGYGSRPGFSLASTTYFRRVAY